MPLRFHGEAGQVSKAQKLGSIHCSLEAALSPTKSIPLSLIVFVKLGFVQPVGNLKVRTPHNTFILSGSRTVELTQRGGKARTSPSPSPYGWHFAPPGAHVSVPNLLRRCQRMLSVPVKYSSRTMPYRCAVPPSLKYTPRIVFSESIGGRGQPQLHRMIEQMNI